MSFQFYRNSLFSSLFSQIRPEMEQKKSQNSFNRDCYSGDQSLQVWQGTGCLHQEKSESTTLKFSITYLVCKEYNIHLTRTMNTLKKKSHPSKRKKKKKINFYTLFTFSKQVSTSHLTIVLPLPPSFLLSYYGLDFQSLQSK